MVKFVRNSQEPYTLITPYSSLSDLENFLKSNIFALSASSDRSIPVSETDAVQVTDSERKFVLGLATLQDLENFVSRRGL
jgi:hypothetical protein